MMVGGAFFIGLMVGMWAWCAFTTWVENNPKEKK